MDPYSDEIALRQQLRRGEEAKRILESDVYKAAWQAYQDRLTEAFKALPAENEKALSRVKACMDVTTFVQAHLETIMQDGQLAAEQVAWIEQEKKRRRWFSAA